MLLTEKHAREKWCPFTRVFSAHRKDLEKSVALGNRTVLHTDEEIHFPKGSDCIGSQCMAWKWGDQLAPDHDRSDQAKGFCGLTQQ